MRTVVITPPNAAVTAAEAKAARVFASDDADTFVDLLLAAAQSQIDGPTGWLGCSIGEQVLEISLDGFDAAPVCLIRLGLPPIVEVISVKYDDLDGVEQTVDPASYILAGDVIQPVSNSFSWPAIRRGGGPRVRYKSGYAADKMPAAIKHAIMLMAAELRTTGQAGGIVRRKHVEGVGSFEYAVPDIVAKQLAATADRLLAGFKAYRV